MKKPNSNLSDLTTNALVAKLAEELEEGLLERWLAEYPEETISSVVTRKRKNRPEKSVSDGKTGWKKPLMKRAFGLLIQLINRQYHGLWSFCWPGHPVPGPFILDFFYWTRYSFEPSGRLPSYEHCSQGNARPYSKYRSIDIAWH